MHRILRGILRPSVYAATALTGAYIATSSNTQREHQQTWQQPLDRISLPQLRDARPVAAASSSKPSHSHIEQRFLAFASVEFNGSVYMTPEDFLESVTLERPKFRRGRRTLPVVEVERMLRRAPSRRQASTKLIRSLGHDGIVSYPEYLFLLCTLANAESGFSIAFNMIDRSRNQSVEKAEFAILNAMVSEWLTEHGQLEEQQTQQQDTTLMRHFFGQSGKDDLDFNQFSKFMSNLQYEVLEIEFMELSRGLPTISESDFARVLLRYTNLSPETQELWVEQVRDKIVREEGINFEDFRRFFQFINNLADLTMALRMYALAGHAVTQDEFQRAVKVIVGYTLAPRVVSTVFLLFDKDGDGSLSSDEFLAILRGRLKRLSPKVASANTRLADFRRCLKREIQKD